MSEGVNNIQCRRFRYKLDGLTGLHLDWVSSRSSWSAWGLGNTVGKDEGKSNE